MTRSACLTADGKPKRTYLTKADAKRVARNGPTGYLKRGPMHHYRCPDCGLYHVGHVGGSGDQT